MKDKRKLMCLKFVTYLKWEKKRPNRTRHCKWPRLNRNKESARKRNFEREFAYAGEFEYAGKFAYSIEFEYEKSYESDKCTENLFYFNTK